MMSILRYLFNKLIKYSFSHSDILFLKLLRIRFMILKINHVIGKNSMNGIKYFFVEDSKKDVRRYFKHKNIGYLNYHNGIYRRALSIGNEVYMLNNINFDNDDLIFDVGANIGDLKLYFDLIVERHINYIAFEPGKDEFECLKFNTNEDNSSIYNIALGESNKTVDFYYKPFNADSSIIKINDYEEKYQISMKTLDSFYEKSNFFEKKIKLLKLEAEGYEPEILYGFKNNLKFVEYISADLGFERGEKQETTSPEVLNFLLKNNFIVINQNSSIRNVFLFKNLKLL